MVAPLRGRLVAWGGTLLFSVPIAMGIGHVPEKVLERRDEAHAVRVSSAIVKQPRADHTFSVVSEEVKERFFTIDSRELGHPSPEAIKEAFFRKEIPYGSIIYREAKRQGLQPELVAAVVEAESNFRPMLISEKNAAGLMQLVPTTGELMGASDLMNPADNIRAGTRYLRYLNKRYQGNQQMMLAAYNAGEGNVARYGGIPPFPETINYVRKVASSKAALQRRINLRIATAQQPYDHAVD